jgi:hypothetical protein
MLDSTALIGIFSEMSFRWSIERFAAISQAELLISSADDALQLYHNNQAVENWHDQLGHLIKFKEDIAVIFCDREILSVVTLSSSALC